MNNEDKKIVQINRVVTPIKINEVNNVINNNNIDIAVKKKKTNANILFILLLSIIFIIVLYILTNYIIPSYNESVDNEIHFNDKVSDINKIKYDEIKSFTLNNGIEITSDGVLNVNNDYLISLSNNMLYVNNNEIKSVSKILPNVGIVNDYLIIGVKYINNDFITLLAITKGGDIALEINDIEGYYIKDDITSIQFNLYSVNILTTNTINDSILLNNEYYNICTNLPSNISDSFVVIRSFSITHQDNSFNTPSSYSSIDLGTYKKVNNYCN